MPNVAPISIARSRMPRMPAPRRAPDAAAVVAHPEDDGVPGERLGQLDVHPVAPACRATLVSASWATR